MLSTLIEFLINLLRDEDAKQAFDQDPQGTLDRNGLGSVSGQDVRDARLIMADEGGVRPKTGDHRPSSNDPDPVREINHTTQHYEAGDTVNIVNIDDRDTILIEDSFNSDDDTEVDVVAVQDNSTTNDIDIIEIEDSFNEAEDEPVVEEEPPVEGEPVPREEPAVEEPVVEEEPIPEPEPELEPEPEPLVV